MMTRVSEQTANSRHAILTSRHDGAILVVDEDCSEGTNLFAKGVDGGLQCLVIGSEQFDF